MGWIVCGSRRALCPGGECGESAIIIRWWPGRRSERAHKWRVACEARLQLVVERDDALFRAVDAVRGDVFFLHDWEGLHDVRHCRAWGGERVQKFGRCRAQPFLGGAEVEVEERGVEFAADFEAALGVVAEHGAVALGPEVLRERGHVVGGGGQLKDAEGEPVPPRCAAARRVKDLWRQHAELLINEEVEMCPAGLESRDEIARKRRKRASETCQGSRLIVSAEHQWQLIPDARHRKHPRDHRSLVRRIRNIPPPEQPLAIPTPCQSRCDFPRRHPVPRQ